MEYGFFGWIVIGLIAGVLAKWIMPGRDPGGLLVTILLGVAGGVLGGSIGQLLGLAGAGVFLNVLIATAGAALLLWAYRAIQARGA